jgi:hypothetical protein
MSGSSYVRDFADFDPLASGASAHGSPMSSALSRAQIREPNACSRQTGVVLAGGGVDVRSLTARRALVSTYKT